MGLRSSLCLLVIFAFATTSIVSFAGQVNQYKKAKDLCAEEGQNQMDLGLDRFAEAQKWDEFRQELEEQSVERLDKSEQLLIQAEKKEIEANEKLQKVRRYQDQASQLTANPQTAGQAQELKAKANDLEQKANNLMKESEKLLTAADEAHTQAVEYSQSAAEAQEKSGIYAAKGDQHIDSSNSYSDCAKSAEANIQKLRIKDPAFESSKFNVRDSEGNLLATYDPASPTGLKDENGKTINDPTASDKFDKFTGYIEKNRKDLQAGKKVFFELPVNKPYYQGNLEMQLSCKGNLCTMESKSRLKRHFIGRGVINVYFGSSDSVDIRGMVFSGKMSDEIRKKLMLGRQPASR